MRKLRNKRRLIASACLAGLAVPGVIAAVNADDTHKWSVTPQNTAWDNADNWQELTVPAANDDIVISISDTNYPGFGIWPVITTDPAPIGVLTVGELYGYTGQLHITGGTSISGQISVRAKQLKLGGQAGSRGYLTISGYAGLELSDASYDAFIGHYGYGKLSVRENGRFQVAGDLNVGWQYGGAGATGGVLLIEEGGYVSVGQAVNIGPDYDNGGFSTDDGQGTVSVGGRDAKLVFGSQMIVSNGRTNAPADDAPFDLLQITDGGQVTGGSADGTGELIIGNTANAKGLIVVDGRDEDDRPSTLKLMDNDAQSGLVIGGAGSSLRVTDGGYVTVPFLSISGDSDMSGVTVSGGFAKTDGGPVGFTPSTLNVGGALTMTGNRPQLYVTDHAQLNVDGDIKVGNASRGGGDIVLQTGGQITASSMTLIGRFYNGFVGRVARLHFGAASGNPVAPGNLEVDQIYIDGIVGITFNHNADKYVFSHKIYKDPNDNDGSGNNVSIRNISGYTVWNAPTYERAAVAVSGGIFAIQGEGRIASRPVTVSNDGVLAIGAAPGNDPAAPGDVGAITFIDMKSDAALTVFNHTNMATDDTRFVAPSMNSTQGTVLHENGVTFSESIFDNWGEVLNLSGGMLVIDRQSSQIVGFSNDTINFSGDGILAIGAPPGSTPGFMPIVLSNITFSGGTGKLVINQQSNDYSFYASYTTGGQGPYLTVINEAGTTNFSQSWAGFRGTMSVTGGVLKIGHNASPRGSVVVQGDGAFELKDDTTKFTLGDGYFRDLNFGELATKETSATAGTMDAPIRFVTGSGRLVFNHTGDHAGPLSFNNTLDAFAGSGHVIVHKAGYTSFAAGWPDFAGDISMTGGIMAVAKPLGGRPYLSELGHLVLTGEGAVSASGGTLLLGASAEDDTSLSFGAAPGADAASAGLLTAGSINFGAGGGTLVFNHTDNLSVPWALASVGSGAHAVYQMAGQTTITGNGSGFAGVTTVRGGTLTLSGSLGGTVALQGGVFDVGGARTIVDLGNGQLTDIGFGAPAGAAPSSPGTLAAPLGFYDQGAGTLFFNHTADDASPLVISTVLEAFSGTGHQILHENGVTIFNADWSAFTGQTTVSGGTLTLYGTIGGDLVLSGGVFGVGGSRSLVDLGNGELDSVYFGARAGADPASPGMLAASLGFYGQDAGTLVFNHIAGGSAPLVFSNALETFSGTGHRIVHENGVTTFSADWSDFTGNLEVSGGILTLTGDFGGAVTVAGAGELVLQGRIPQAAGVWVVAPDEGDDSRLSFGAAPGETAAPAPTPEFRALNFGSGSGQLVFNHTDDLTVTFDLTSVGSGAHVIAHQAGHTTITGNGSGFTGTTTVSGGILSINGTLAGDFEIGPGGTLAGTGHLGGPMHILDGGTVSPGNSVGTITTDDDIFFAGGSVFNLEFSETGDTSDEISTSGKVIIAEGAVLDIVEGFPVFGVPYVVVSAEEITGTFTVEGNDSEFVSFVFDDQGQLIIERDPETFIDAADTLNELGVAGALDAIEAIDETTPPVPAVAMTEDVEQARAAFNALSGEIGASIKGALVDNARGRADLVMRRTALTAGEVRRVFGADLPHEAGAQSVEPPPDKTDRFDVWASGYGYWRDTDATENTAELSNDVIGGVASLNYLWGSHGTIGLFAGYEQADIEQSARGSSGQTDTWTAGAAAAGSFGRYSLVGGLSYDWHHVDVARDVYFETGTSPFQETVTASYDATGYQLFGEISALFSPGNVEIKPFIDLSYSRLDSDGYQEQGNGGGAALTAHADTTDVGYTTFGTRAAYAVNSTVEIGATGGWRLAWGDTDPTMDYTLSGVDFLVEGAPLAENSFVGALSLSAKMNGLSFNLTYHGQFGDGLASNGADVGVSFRF